MSQPLGSLEQHIIVSRNAIQGGITELNTAAVEAIADAIEKALVGSQQEHGSIVAGGVSGLVVAQLMVEQLHPGFVMAVRPEIAGIVWEQDGQAVPKNAPAGNHSFDCTPVGNHPGFDSFCQKGADLMAAAQLCGQDLLLDTMESEQATPSLSQAQRLRKLSQTGELNEDTMLSIMMEQMDGRMEVNADDLTYCIVLYFPEKKEYHKISKV